MVQQTEEINNNVAGNLADETSQDNATVLLSLEELIKKHAESIYTLQEEIKKAREMYEDGFNNNPTFREASEKVKEVNKSKALIRQQIAMQPSIATLAQKIKDLRFDLNEQKKTYSDLLIDYKEQTGVTQLELFNGQVVEIILTAKTVRR